MRSAPATRELAEFRRFFLTGLPPLVGRWGASVTCDTNSFSVGKRLKSGPYSLSTTCTISTPMASMLVISAPLIRYSACRIGSWPFFDRLGFLRILHRRRRLVPKLLRLHGAQPAHNFPVVIGDALLDGVVHLQRFPQTEQVILSPVPAQLLGDLLLALLAASVPQLRQFPGIPLSLYDGAQNRHPRHSVHIGNRPVHPHVHLVQTLLHPPHPVARLRYQIGLVPHQRAQHAHVLPGPKRAPQQPAAVQPLNPLTVSGIAFLVPAGHPRQLPRVYQQNFQTHRFQDLVGSDPVDSRALHGHRLLLALLEPFPHAD